MLSELHITIFDIYFASDTNITENHITSNRINPKKLVRTAFQILLT